MAAQVISNPSGDSNEKIEHAALLLRKRPNCKKVFEAAYRNKKQVKTYEEIADATNLPMKAVYKAAQTLRTTTIVDSERIKNKLALKKVPFYTTHRDEILRLAENSNNLKKYPTKRKAVRQPTLIVKFQLPKKQFPLAVTIDDIDSFQKVKNVRSDKKLPDVSDIKEDDVKKKICEVIGETPQKDWGGEKNDIFSSKVVFKKKRIIAAFALKGRGTRKLNKGQLVPASMGKNGDQIQRLVNSSADLFMVQFNGPISEAILEQLKELVIAKSLLHNKKYYYGIIDGDDTARLFVAY